MPDIQGQHSRYFVLHFELSQVIAPAFHTSKAFADMNLAQVLVDSMELARRQSTAVTLLSHDTALRPPEYTYKPFTYSTGCGIQTAISYNADGTQFVGTYDDDVKPHPKQGTGRRAKRKSKSPKRRSKGITR